MASSSFVVIVLLVGSFFIVNAAPNPLYYEAHLQEPSQSSVFYEKRGGFFQRNPKDVSPLDYVPIQKIMPAVNYLIEACQEMGFTKPSLTSTQIDRGILKDLCFAGVLIVLTLSVVVYFYVDQLNTRIDALNSRWDSSRTETKKAEVLAQRMQQVAIALINDNEMLKYVNLSAFKSWCIASDKLLDAAVAAVSADYKSFTSKDPIYSDNKVESDLNENRVIILAEVLRLLKTQVCTTPQMDPSKIIENDGREPSQELKNSSVVVH